MIKDIKEYIDFNDVFIKPKISNIESRKEVNLKLNIKSKNNLLNTWHPIPIISSNMDTITGTRMAFELLKHNLIAVLHKYIEIEKISNLFDKIDNYNLQMKKINFLNPNDNDIKFLEKEGLIPKLDEELLIDLNFEKLEEIKEQHKNLIKNKLKELSKKKYQIDYRNLFISRGTSEKDKIKLKERLIQEKRIQSICIDVANGYRKSVFNYIKELKNSLCKDKILMVGNVATYDAVIEYSKVGADIVKIGIGPGSACITRVKTGVGIPQIGTMLEIKKHEKEFHCLICLDGGCVIPGDIAKAFVAGANFVMIGGMLAGHKECPGVIENVNGKKMMRFSGMAATESQWNGVPEYGTNEGKTVMIPYKGKVKNTIFDILGGIRSTCTYTNCKNINELQNDVEFIKTTVQENKIFSN